MPTWLLIVFAAIGAVSTLATLWLVVRDRRARPSLRVELEPIGRDLDETGALILPATRSSTRFALKIANSGRKAAGHTAVSIWAPRAHEVYWTSDRAGHDLAGAPRAGPSVVVLRAAAAIEYETVELSRSLDAVPRVGETLYFRVSCSIEHRGELSVPLRVRVRADGAKGDAEADFPIRLVHQPAHQ